MLAAVCTQTYRKDYGVPASGFLVQPGEAFARPLTHSDTLRQNCRATTGPPLPLFLHISHRFPQPAVSIVRCTSKTIARDTQKKKKTLLGDSDYTMAVERFYPRAHIFIVHPASLETPSQSVPLMDEAVANLHYNDRIFKGY